MHLLIKKEEEAGFQFFKDEYTAVVPWKDAKNDQNLSW